MKLEKQKLKCISINKWIVCTTLENEIKLDELK